MALIELPEDERFVAEGVITESKGVGGGLDFAPPAVQVIINGQALRIDRGLCMMCGPVHMQRGNGPWGRGDLVVVSMVHNHYVVRTVPGSTQTACGAC